MFYILRRRRIGIDVIRDARTIQAVMHKSCTPGSREINMRMPQVHADHAAPVTPAGYLLHAHLRVNDRAYFRVRKSTTQSVHE